MSEYQYYEFLAIDRPLTSEETSALRKLSTRAQITPVSFTNEYNWGDFKGDPDKLMQQYFDAHVYVANWMTAIFMVRLPIEALSKEMAKALAVNYTLDFKAVQTHWIITWSLEESENYDRFGMENGRDWMARLAPVRDELLRGDIRSLYIGWLASVTAEMPGDDEMEPLLLSGLGNLTSSQQALAQFLEVDPDILAGAGMGSPDLKDGELSQKQMDQWINGLPQDEMKAVMKQILEGRGQQAERTVRNRFMAWQHSLKKGNAKAPRQRTVGELRKNAKIAEKIRLEQEKNNREQREIQRRKEREAYLKNLSKDFPSAWKSVRQTVKRGSGLAYDQGCSALVDMHEAYSLVGSQKRFQQDLNKFMTSHMQRKALIQRLVKTGVWKER
ncbi:MAG: hypothetical protein KKE62_12610 [Proteobacteria bacterium]|nr:hypothetical protein [Pseudomonadota bacterium]MBU1387229.1 hypothetical protein [Pseudomonadota bacterium]MBU1543673.1 hypothetical protein [Pseudomonadota bacterium]MBU2429061.1 hypothetical protein [Pseudomonadota bacterium]MBU2480029.1 hypothetical protein [Pseudomonadota bacterium]